jgi:hypothetical protein
VQRLLRQHKERAGHYQVVTVDEADKGEDRNHHHVVRTERDAVELAYEHVAGR